MKNKNGATLVKAVVFVGDFVIVNILLTIFIQCFHSLIPGDVSDKLLYFMVNVAMLMAQYFFSTIIYIRGVSMEKIIMRSFSLVLAHVAFLFFLVHVLTDSGGFFDMGMWFGLDLFVVICLARFAEREFLKDFRKRGYNNRNVLFVGSDPANLRLYKKMSDDLASGLRVLGYFANHHVVDAPREFNYLGTREMFAKVMDIDMDVTISGHELKIDEIYCCLSHDESDYIHKVMRFCEKNVIRFYYVPRQLGAVRASLRSHQVLDETVLVPRDLPLSSGMNPFVKRAFDIVVSGVVCLCMLPFIPIIALCIKSQSRGPLFFRQKRTGIDGKVFNCLKFRSMHVNADADKVQATKDDPRKFPFGNFMRKTNIDEFPQFFNVLRGDMSIVGPRPHMLSHTKIYGDLIEKYMVRHFVKPGITGWAQVTGCRGETKELWQMEERVQKDVWYIENWSFLLDLRIIWKTAFTVFCPDEHAY